ncbi:hypothetical protein bcgnr5386_16380 [Bacillus cereus]
MKNANMPKGRGMVKWQPFASMPEQFAVIVIRIITLPLGQAYGSFYLWQSYDSKIRLC